jgi:hypothetical protein
LTCIERRLCHQLVCLEVPETVYGTVWGHGRLLEKKFLPHLVVGPDRAELDEWLPRLPNFLAMEFLENRVEGERVKHVSVVWHLLSCPSFETKT